MGHLPTTNSYGSGPSPGCCHSRMGWPMREGDHSYKVSLESSLEIWDLLDVHLGNHLKDQLLLNEALHIRSKRLGFVFVIVWNDARDFIPIEEHSGKPGGLRNSNVRKIQHAIFQATPPTGSM